MTKAAFMQAQDLWTTMKQLNTQIEIVRNMSAVTIYSGQCDVGIQVPASWIKDTVLNKLEQELHNICEEFQKL